MPLEPFTPCVSVGWSLRYTHIPYLDKCPCEHYTSSPSKCLWIFQEACPDSSSETWDIFAVMGKHLSGDPRPDCDGLSSPSLWTEHFCLKWENLFEHKVGYCVY